VGGKKSTQGCHSHESGNPVNNEMLFLDSRLRGNDKGSWGVTKKERKFKKYFIKIV